MLGKSTNLFKILQRSGNDFWKFWIGQTISDFGSSFTLFAWPLLVFKLTHSAFNLAISSISEILPWLLFGFVIGAWIDRVNRKRLMIGSNVGNAAIIASIPLLASLNLLSIWYIYIAGFIGSILSICFAVAQAAAVPSLVSRENLAPANGRIQASSSAASIMGPLLAGVLITAVPLSTLLLLDAFSFIISAISLLCISTSFNLIQEHAPTRLRDDIVEGLYYVWRHPVIRNIAIIAALVNTIGVTVGTQLVFFAEYHFQASDTQVGLLFSAGNAGVIILSLGAGLLRKYISFSKLALGASMLNGLVVLLFALNPWYWAALPLWALRSGLLILFNINIISLRQAIVPNRMLGRVASTINVIGQSISPLGTIIGGLVIERTKQVTLVYGVIGILIFLITLAFSFTPLGHAERYLLQKEGTGESL